MNKKENLLRTIRHQYPEWVPNGMESQIMIGPPIVERPDCTAKDAFGVQWELKQGADGGTYPTADGYTITDLSKWDAQITIPDLSSLDWSDAVQKANELERGGCLVSGFVEMGLFERSYLLLGMEEALIAYICEPETMGHLVSAIADYKIDLIGLFDDAVNLDIVWYGDDWGTQTDLFLPPEIWRKVIKPHTQRIYDALKDRDILINQHSCGKIDAIFGDVVEMGADVWNPCQPCNDLSDMKQKYYGQIAFCGGIDSQFVLARPGVTPSEVKAEVRKRIDEMARGGGYIAAPSHSVPYDREILDAMNNEIDRYGRAL